MLGGFTNVLAITVRADVCHSQQQHSLLDTAARLRDSLHRKELRTATVGARWDNYRGIYIHTYVVFVLPSLVVVFRLLVLSPTLLGWVMTTS